MGLIKKQFRCHVCGGWFRREEGSGLAFWRWTCHRCRSTLAAEGRQATQPTTPPAGWMRDPHNPEGERWWDGTDWTHHTR